MECAYEASTSLDAHMILNLLQQEGIYGRVEGEYLQGGVGELQAMNVIRVVVDAENLSAARKIIRDWEALQPEPANEAEIQAPPSNGLLKFIAGIAVGIGGMYWAYSVPVYYDGIDYNQDGNLDEKWTYVSDRLSKTEIDRNLDGEFDFIYRYDRKGLTESSVSDEDFDGVFESETYYRNGNAVWSKSDTSGDGFKDYRMDFKHGVINTITFLDPGTKKPLKIQKFDAIKLISSEVDTNGDGTLDTVYEYDSIEEIVEK